MPLGMELDFGAGHILLDGVRAPHVRDTAAPLFSALVYCGHGRPSQLLLSSSPFLLHSDVMAHYVLWLYLFVCLSIHLSQVKSSTKKAKLCTNNMHDIQGLLMSGMNERG